MFLQGSLSRIPPGTVSYLFCSVVEMLDERFYDLSRILVLYLCLQSSKIMTVFHVGVEISHRRNGKKSVLKKLCLFLSFGIHCLWVRHHSPSTFRSCHCDPSATAGARNLQTCCVDSVDRQMNISRGTRRYWLKFFNLFFAAPVHNISKQGMDYRAEMRCRRQRALHRCIYCRSKV